MSPYTSSDDNSDITQLQLRLSNTSKYRYFFDATCLKQYPHLIASEVSKAINKKTDLQSDFQAKAAQILTLLLNDLILCAEDFFFFFFAVVSKNVSSTISL